MADRFVIGTSAEERSDLLAEEADLKAWLAADKGSTLRLTQSDLRDRGRRLQEVQQRLAETKPPVATVAAKATGLE